METLHYATVPSPVGPLMLVVSEKGIVRLEFGGRTPPFGPGTRLQESAQATRAYAVQLTEYFAGERMYFDLPLDLRGTAFQRQCWQALLQIPYGQTRSYAEMARAVGRARAFRAVGMANHSNPVAIIVPCHRVIGADGSLTGYGGGLETKRRLLALEAAVCRSKREK